MNRQFLTIAPTATVRQAINMILDHAVSGLPVVDQAGQLIGVVSELALNDTFYRPALLDASVRQVLLRNLITVSPRDPLRCVANLFQLQRVRILPVVEGDRCVGLITRRDLMRFLRMHPELLTAS